jgi:hypothetical protein
MALNQNQIPVYAITPRTSVGKILAADSNGTLGTTTGAAIVYTAGANGSIIDSIQISTDDAAIAPNIWLFIVGSDGTTVKPLTTVPVVVNSGLTSTVYAVDGLSTTYMTGALIDSNGKRHIRLGANETLRASRLASQTAAKSIWITAMGADF